MIIIEYAECLAIGIILTVVLPILFLTKSPRLVNNIPTFCTGVGVLFTFAVLYYTLTDKNLQIDEIGQVKDLVNDLAKAFSTSLIGIASSLVFSFFTKLRLDYLERKAGNSQHPAELLKELSNKVEQQKDQVHKLARIVLVISQGSKGKIEKLFDTLDRKLAKHVTDLSQTAVRSFQGELEASTKDLVGTYNKILSNGAENTLKILKGQSVELERSFQVLADLQVRSTSALESSSSVFSNAVTQYDKLQQETDGLIQRLNCQQEVLDKLSTDTQLLLKIIDKRSLDITTLQTKVNDIGRVIQQLDGLKEKLELLNLVKA